MSPARPRTSRAAIIAAARVILEDGGLDAVTVTAVAERVGVKAPSMYKHFADRNALIAAVASDVLVDLGRTMAGAAEASGADPSGRLPALADAYRAYSRATPRAASLLFSGVDERTTPTMEAQAAAVRPILETAEALAGRAHALAAARVIVAFAHGFTSMESAGAFRLGGDVDEAYRLGIAALIDGLAARVPPPSDLAPEDDQG